MKERKDLERAPGSLVIHKKTRELGILLREGYCCNSSTLAYFHVLTENKLERWLLDNVHKF